MKLKVEFFEIEQSFDVAFTETDRTFDIGFENLLLVPEKLDFEYYTGNYEVIPEVTEQVLQTKQKMMEEDVIVKPVPYAEVSNTSNGTTVTIGK